VQPAQQPDVQPAQQPVRKSTRKPRRQSVRQPAKQPALKSVRKSTWEPRRQSVRQPAQQQPQDEDDDEDLELSDFEVIDEEEEDIFTESEENVLRQAREETSKWYQSWDKPSTSKEGCDAAVDPDDMSPNSETFDSMSSEEDAEGEHHPKRVKRYPEWMPKRDLKEKVQLSVGLKFSNPTEFKKTLQVFAVQNSLTTNTSTMRRRGSPQFAREIVHGEYTQAGPTANHTSRSKPSTQIIIVAAITTTSGHQYLGLLIDT
jgi:hypothetical protein